MGLDVGDFVKDLASDVKATWLERVSNPLTGALSLSWITVNYKLFFVLFSSTDYKSKFDFIDNTLYPDLNSWISKIVILPCLFAILYIYVLPFPGEKVYRWTLNRKRNLAIAEQEAAGEQVITGNRAAEILEVAALADARTAEALASVEGLRIAHSDEIKRNEENATKTTDELHRQIAEIQERVRADVAKYKVAIINQRWHITIIDAFSKARNGDPDALGAMSKFITARPFALQLGPERKSSPITFRSDGSVTDIFERGGVQWKLNTADQLIVLDQDGRLYGSFDFLSKEGLWYGRYAEVNPATLHHQRPDVAHEADRDILELSSQYL